MKKFSYVNSFPVVIATKIMYQATVGTIFEMDMLVSNQINYHLSSNLDGATLIEVAILRSGLDSKDTYVIFRPRSSNVPVQVSAKNGDRTLTCTDQLV